MSNNSIELSQNSVHVILSFLVQMKDKCIIDSRQWAQAAELKWQKLYRDFFVEF